MKAMKKNRKLYKYSVVVETRGQLDCFIVDAHNAEEAKNKAKDKFIQVWWKRSRLKATVDYREEVRTLM